MRLGIILLLSQIFLFPLGLMAQDDFKPLKDPATFEKKVKEITDITKTIHCDFVQEKTLSFLNDPIITKGVFYFQKEDKIRWEYEKPFSYVIILNGGKLLIDDNGNQNEMDLSNNQTFKEVNSMLTRTLQGDILTKDERFSYDLFENKEFVMVRLVPTTDTFKAYIKAIKVYFDKKDMMVARVDMLEGEDLTKITFQNREINVKLAQNLFQTTGR
ncbi:MAG: outer membrane lipoprotein carrier protein LolA [Saprospiraceae bacterium]|nr:outer membrane lipoprotein carrier protein LolA [Saprospiraceae bacterium]